MHARVRFTFRVRVCAHTRTRNGKRTRALLLVSVVHTVTTKVLPPLIGVDAGGDKQPPQVRCPSLDRETVPGCMHAFRIVQLVVLVNETIA